MNRLAGKTALVTGCAINIGRAIALTLGREGASIVCFDYDCGGAEAIADEIRRAGGRAVAAPGDVREPADVEAALELAERSFGTVDALVNNAAITINKTLLETSLEEWNAVLATTLSGPFIVSRAVARRMIGHALTRRDRQPRVDDRPSRSRGRDRLLGGERRHP